MKKNYALGAIVNNIKNTKDPVLVIMIGLSGSGKTTKAKLLSETLLNLNIQNILLSSDDIRKELTGSEKNQTMNSQVFEVMQKRAVDYLKQGNVVIYDATNLTIKSRANIIHYIHNHKLEPKILAYVINTSFFQASLQNFFRKERIVPTEVLLKQRSQFQVPLKQEGIYEIVLDNMYKTTRETRLEAKQKIFYTYYHQMINIDQNNPHHSHSLLVHTVMVQEYMKAHGASKILQDASFLHDIGKLVTRTTDENNISHYYGHANVGAEMLLSNSVFLQAYAVDELLELVALVNYHMDCFTWQNENTIQRKKDFFGEEFIQKLMLLHEGDKKSC